MQRQLIFDTILNRIRNNKFLPIDTGVGDLFAGTDTKQLYNENLKTQPNDWYYRNNKVTYTLNSQGYRTQEFKNIDWKNSIVVFGCSNVFGVGVDDKDTMPFQLSKITGMPVVNLGMGGSSMLYALHNSSILRDGYPAPKAVVHMWTGIDRTVYYHKRSLKFFGNWNIRHNNYMDLWSTDKHNPMTQALFISKISKWMWKDVKYFEGTYFADTAKFLNCYQVEIFDNARDLMHFGIQTHYNVALKIAKELK